MEKTKAYKSFMCLIDAIENRKLDLLKPLLRKNCYYHSDLINRGFYSAGDILSHMDWVHHGSNCYSCHPTPLHHLLRAGTSTNDFRYYSDISPFEHAILLYENDNFCPSAVIVAMIEPNGMIGSVVFSRNTTIFNVEFSEEKADIERRHPVNPFQIHSHHAYNPYYISLSHYPVKDRGKMCWEYLHSIDWENIDRKIEQNGVDAFDVSDVVDIFPHLELDENYRLYCYVSSEYHGLWGSVATVKKGELHTPLVDSGKNFPLRGHDFELPEGASPPMEAVYCDGTPEGYLDALLMKNLLSSLPYGDIGDTCLLSQPDDYPKAWNIDVDISDLSPRLKYSGQSSVRLITCWRHFESPFAPFDGLDHIRLSSHEFLQYPSLCWIANPKEASMYKSHIRDDSRYNDARHCCVTTSSSITIAKQKRRSLEE